MNKPLFETYVGPDKPFFQLKIVIIFLSIRFNIGLVVSLARK